MKILLKIVPGSSQNIIAGWLGESLKIKVGSPPESGKANKAVIALLASQLNIPKTAITIISGGKSSHKILKINTLTEKEIMERLNSIIKC